QDLNKAYDRVNIHMLDRAMARIRILTFCQNFLLNLFSKRSNRVIGLYRLMDPYNLQIEIDQGEVISPLLWCIYYDSLLTKIQENDNLGYTLTHTWQPDLTKNEFKFLSERITSQAYMDDTGPRKIHIKVRGDWQNFGLK